MYIIFRTDAFIAHSRSTDKSLMLRPPFLSVNKLFCSQLRDRDAFRFHIFIPEKTCEFELKNKAASELTSFLVNFSKYSQANFENLLA